MAKDEKIRAILSEGRVITKEDNLSKNLYNQSRFGEMLRKGEIHYSLVEALFLLEQDKMEIVDGHFKEISFDKFLRKASKLEANFWVKFCVFRDMRLRGYIVKTALKFGADFRVYDRGIKPGEDHAKWILYPVKQGSTFTWFDFAAKNRVAHSTKKNLLIGIVDEENSVTYYEIRWTKP